MTPGTSSSLSGIERCSRYAFGPNRLHYCGPDSNPELKAYIEAGVSDPGLEHILTDFKTMFPYLKKIADVNGIADAFDDRVVEAYWIGNTLLEAVGKRPLYDHIVRSLDLKKRLDPRAFASLESSIEQGAVPHHSFHVLEIWRRTGAADRPLTLQNLDECRVSSGTVTAVDGPTITVRTEPLLLEGNRLYLGTPLEKKLSRHLAARYDIEQLKPGDIVSIHWSVACETLTKKQAETLKKYTLQHIALANLSL